MKKTFNITILDYSWSKVWRLAIHASDLDFSDDKDESEAIEQWLVDNGFTLNNLEWMETDDLEIYTNVDI
jgi:hypothetical protein